MNNQANDVSRAKIFKAIKDATSIDDPNVSTIEAEALALLAESEFARPALLAEDATDALMQRIDNGLVIGTTCEKIPSLTSLPQTVKQFLLKHSLAPALKIQEIDKLTSLDWDNLETNIDVHEDNSVGLCWAEYGVAETGSFVVHSSEDMPILLNFLPLYLLAVVPQSKVLHYMDDYALIANNIAKNGNTPRNMCLISGVSGTTDIEGVLVQGAHGPEILHIVIVEDE